MKENEGVTKKRIFISFDYERDRDYRYLLKALSENPRSDIAFDDCTPEEIQSLNIPSIKAVLTRKIRDATHTLVVVGKHANSYHPDRGAIGCRNWQWWEINKSKEEGKGFIAVKIDRTYSSPEPLYEKGAEWAMSFTVKAIHEAIRRA